MCATSCGHGLSQLCGQECNLAVCLLSFINVSFRAASYLAEGAACNGNDEVVAKGRRCGGPTNWPSPWRFSSNTNIKYQLESTRL